jgi:hypothetical protein
MTLDVAPFLVISEFIPVYQDLGIQGHSIEKALALSKTTIKLFTLVKCASLLLY